jgi:hypothetical protein
VCGTKNFVSARLYSAPQSHWMIVAIFGICAFGESVQAGSFAAIKSDPPPLGVEGQFNCGGMTGLNGSAGGAYLENQPRFVCAIDP